MKGVRDEKGKEGFMIAERDYFGLSPIRTHEIYTEDQEEKERLRTRVGELEDELEKESR